MDDPKDLYKALKILFVALQSDAKILDVFFYYVEPRCEWWNVMYKAKLQSEATLHKNEGFR